MPKLEPASNRLVAVLLYEGLCAFEFGIAAEVFGLDRPELGEDWYRFVTCSEGGQPVRASINVQVTPEAGLDVLATAGTIVIPGWSTAGEPPSQAVTQAVRGAYANGARLVTICSGVFLIAALGLVQSKRVATHWKYVDRLRQLHPMIMVEPDVLYIDEDDILTSAGSAAGIDLLLYLVRKDFGAEVANHVARRMVVPPHREGGQAQYTERPVAERDNGRLGPLLERIRAAPGEAWTIQRMADEAAMSSRTFIRRFNEAVGMSPGEWLVSVRTEGARDLLEAGAHNLDEVAELSGFGSLATLRHHFRNRVGVAPATYRARFAGAVNAA